MLDQCSETCGWVAGIIAAISFGTFGVPIKSTKAKIKVDPLVMQSYKSLLCFLTCWLVIPLGEPFKFTPWGIGMSFIKPFCSLYFSTPVIIEQGFIYFFPLFHSILSIWDILGPRRNSWDLWYSKRWFGCISWNLVVYYCYE